MLGTNFGTGSTTDTLITIGQGIILHNIRMMAISVQYKRNITIRFGRWGGDGAVGGGSGCPVSLTQLKLDTKQFS